MLVKGLWELSISWDLFTVETFLEQSTLFHVFLFLRKCLNYTSESFMSKISLLRNILMTWHNSLSLTRHFISLRAFLLPRGI